MKYNHFIYGVLLLVIDFIFVYTFMSKKYQIMVSKIQKSPMVIKYEFVLLSYFLMLLGLYIFVLPKLEKKNKRTIKYGFFYGIILYGVYDFVCASIFQDWDLKLMVIDIIWGGFVYSLISMSYIYIPV